MNINELETEIGLIDDQIATLGEKRGELVTQLKKALSLESDDNAEKWTLEDGKVAVGFLRDDQVYDRCNIIAVMTPTSYDYTKGQLTTHLATYSFVEGVPCYKVFRKTLRFLDLTKFEGSHDVYIVDATEASMLTDQLSQLVVTPQSFPVIRESFVNLINR